MSPSHLPQTEDGTVMPAKRSRGPNPPITYQIIVHSELSRRYGAVFEGMTLVAGNGQTAITGPVRDQTHLHGQQEAKQPTSPVTAAGVSA
jgi:hypothetical protein